MVRRCLYFDFRKLPLSLLRAAKGSAILVELKSGETYNGHLVSTDAYMNVTVADVICTAASGDRFWKLPSANIRGSAIKYLRLPDNCLDIAQQEDDKQSTIHEYRGGRRGGGYSEGQRSGGRGSGGRHFSNSDQRGGGGGRGRGGRYDPGGRSGNRGSYNGGRTGRYTPTGRGQR